MPSHARRRLTVHQAYRFSLDPTVAQRRALAGHCGAARFAFNWGLEQVRAATALREFELCMYGEVRSELVGWSLPALRREWNRNKDTVAPWWAEHSKEAYSSGLAALAAALRNWRQSRSGDRRGEPAGFPRFRKRGSHDSCRFTTGAIRVDDARRVTLPRLGQLRTAEATTALQRRLNADTARIISATVSREADRWFVSFTCVVEREVAEENGHTDTVGVDLGVHVLAALSSGELVEGPRALPASLRRLRRLQRTVSRRRKGGARRGRAVRRLARAHRRVANLRRDHLNKLTTRLAKSHGRIVVEDLNVRGMSQSARGSVDRPGCNVRAKAGLNRGLGDAAFGELRRMLDYKCAWYGSEFVVADRFFASSKRCSMCGAVRAELGRGERVHSCDVCGVSSHRDLNAARNLVWWAETHDVAGSAPETENARGAAERSGLSGDGDVEAGTGTVPEPTGITTGGHHRPGLPLIPRWCNGV